MVTSNMGLDNTKRMAALQAKGAGAPPAEPPMAPPGMMEPDGDEPMGGPPPGPEMGGGMPPPDQAIPAISEALSMMAQSLPDEQKNLVMSAVQQLQTAFPTNSPNSGGMSAEDSEAYGEQPAV